MTQADKTKVQVTESNNISILTFSQLKDQYKENFEDYDFSFLWEDIQYNQVVFFNSEDNNINLEIINTSFIN